jgi:chromosome segregation ATPase
MRDIVMQSPNMHVDKPPYTMQLLLEEVTTLRSRVKELEEDGASGGSGRTAPSFESHESMENQEVVVLRKQLMKVESDRADLEKDFMNQLSMLAQENRENVEKLQKKLKMAECEKKIIKANGSFEQSEEVWELEQEITQLKAVIAANGDDGLQQLVGKLSTTEKELKDVQEQNKNLRGKVEELDSQKSTLLEEITHVRIDYDREVKTASSLRTEMEEMAKDFDLQLEKFQHDFMDQEEAIQRHEESFGDMHDTIVELEGQKALLLDEITGLRLELDREKQTKTELKERIEELTKATIEAGDYKLISMEKRATAAEENNFKLQDTVNGLQDELRRVTGSYKSDTDRLEECLSSRDSRIDELELTIVKQDQLLKGTEEKIATASHEVKEMKRQLEIKEKDAAEKHHEIASMVSQRISYEKRSTQSIMDHVAEVDDLRRHVSELEGELAFFKNKLHEVKTSAFGEQQMTSLTRSSQRPSPRLSTPTRRRSSSGAFQFPPPLSPAPLTPTRAMSRAELDQQMIGPRTPVRDIRKKFERSVASGSSRGVSSNDRDRPTDESDISVSSAEAEAFAHKADFESQQVRDLQEKLQKQSELVGELRAEIATLTATRGAQAIIMEKEYADKSRDDEERIASLTSQLEDTRCQLESETELVKALREELNILALEKVANNDNGGSSPERLKAIALERNRMANAVTAAQMEKTNMERELMNTIRALEDTIETMNAEIDAELAEKQVEIDTLQCKLDNEFEMVKRMEKEREQICMNINSVSNSKKVEIDELHEELMAMTATAAAQAREINSLMVQVETQKDASEELEYLRMKLRDLEKRSNDTGMSKDEMDKLWSENQRLNDNLRKMSLERGALQEKLSAVMSEKSASKSVQVLRERNTALKKEVERLSRRVRQSEVSAKTNRIEI